MASIALSYLDSIFTYTAACTHGYIEIIVGHYIHEYQSAQAIHQVPVFSDLLKEVEINSKIPVSNYIRCDISRILHQIIK